MEIISKNEAQALDRFPPANVFGIPKNAMFPQKKMISICFCVFVFVFFFWGKIAIVGFPTCSLGGPSGDWVPFFSWFTFVIFSIWIWVCFWFVCFFYLFVLWKNFSANIEIYGIATVQKSSLNLCLQGFGPPIAVSAIPDINVQGKSCHGMFTNIPFLSSPQALSNLYKKSVPSSNCLKKRLFYIEVLCILNASTMLYWQIATYLFM